MQAPDRPRRPIAPDAAHPAILAREVSHHVPGAIRGIVIDKDDLPGGTRQRRLQPVKQRGDVVALVEGRDNDRKLRRDTRPAAGFRSPV